MDQKKFKPSPRIKIIQKIYNSLMNKDTIIEFPKTNTKSLSKTL